MAGLSLFREEMKSVGEVALVSFWGNTSPTNA